MKISPDKSINQKFKPFEVDILPITWKKRCELNDMMIESNADGKIPSFSWWGNVVLKYTEIKEDKLNDFSTDEIIAIANAIFEEANKKK